MSENVSSTWRPEYNYEEQFTHQMETTLILGTPDLY